MLKAIVTVLDENDKIIQANRLIFEERCIPTGFGTEHKFEFGVVTLDDELVDRFNKSLTGFTLRADEIKKACENGTDIDEEAKNRK